MTRDSQTAAAEGVFQAGGTPGGRWGAALGGAFFACSLPMLMILLAFGGEKFWLWRALLPVLAGAVGLGLGVRFLVNLAWRRKGGAEAGGPPGWSLALSFAALVGAVWAMYAWWLSL